MTLTSDAPTRETVATATNRGSRVRAVAAGIAIAAGVLLFSYSRSDLWLDEALSVNIARLPLGDLRAALERDGAPPLYYVLLHGWTGLFGSGDIAARSPGAVFAVGAVVACWYAARRCFDSTTAWLTVVVMATNPYLIRYATEARMYMLEVLLVACGIVVVLRALERPTFARLALVGVVTALLVYTQYWAFYLVGVVTVAFLVVAWRHPERRRGARRVVFAIGVGLLAFAPWIPTFLSQRAHTGTPWGDPVLPGLPIGETFLGFAGGHTQEGWLLLLVLLAVLGLGLLARAVDPRHLEVDLRVQPSARWIACIGGATLVVGVSLNYLAGQAFQPRYSAIVFPFFALLLGRGLATLVDPRVQFAVVAVIVALGLAGGVRNLVTQRTRAGAVATVLESEARRGDLVVYCPDQLGPAVHRLLPGGLDEVTYPEFAAPAFVDWVDYQRRIDAVDPQEFADTVAERAGAGTVWFVTGPGYPNHHGVCGAISARLAESRDRVERVVPDETVFEKAGLQQFVSPVQ
ncbi:MAG: glycosyltransferase family 39 protein [Acidimicrobiia bacterium]